MRIVIAMDSFKGTYTSLEVADFVKRGIQTVYPDAEVNAFASADGGEGTAGVLAASLGGRMVQVRVQDPLGRPVSAEYALLPDGTAVIEMASAAGLPLVKAQLRDPCAASTYGVGQLMLDAMQKGSRKIILGLGGSATNDAGTGMASALGVRFLDAGGNELPPGGKALGSLARIDVSGLSPLVGITRFLAACDVENPLYGENGASAVFGPQKGADGDAVRVLDDALRHFGAVVKEQLGRSVANVPGAGAAGGMGAGLLAFCGVKLQKGVELVLDYLGFDDAVQQAELVITGEGRLDAQTVFGKVPVGVARRAKRYGKPVYAIAGFLGDGAREVYGCGIDGVFSSVTAPMTLHEAITQSPKGIEHAAENLMRVLKSAPR